MLLIDYEIPDHVKIKTDELPHSLLHYTLNHEDTSTFTQNILERANMKHPR